MTRQDKQIWRLLGGYILDNRSQVIHFLNRNGYANLTPNASLKQVNDAVANNMEVPGFIEQFVILIYSDGYYNQAGAVAGSGAGAGTAGLVNPVTAIATAISMLITSISGAVQQAKMATFQRLQSLRLESRQKEYQDAQLELMEINARKEMSLSLQKAQQELIIERDVKTEREKNLKNFMIFGVFLVGALALTFMIVKMRKNK